MSATELTAAVDAAIAAEEALDAKIAGIRAEIARLTEELAAKDQELRAAVPWWGGRQHGRKAALLKLKATLAEGATPIAVRATSSFPSPGHERLTGAIVKRTATRVTVLTENGEMVFALSPKSKWDKPGCSWGDAGRGWRIDPADLPPV